MLRQSMFIRAALCLLIFLPADAGAALTVTPSTWNIIGLDSNDVNNGPNRFPVGAKVCSTTSVTDVAVTLTWDSANAYIALRAGSSNPITIPSIGAGGCVHAFFEVDVQRNASAFETSRKYHISAGGASTPTPRELYVERLISQSRNSITDVKLDGISIPSGGSMNLVVGNTYAIEVRGGTATQGYSQFAQHINLPNTVFQILSVSTTYSADDSPYVSNPNDGVYADACLWENDPDSPFYRSCVGGDYKAGGSTVVATYSVTIADGGGTSETLASLLYDFSGASYHYNADYSTGARVINVIDPTSVNISKSFTPDPVNAGGVSALTFTLSNPNAAVVNGLNFTDTFPTTPGNMVVADPPNATTNGCGTPTFAPSAGAGSISFSGGTIAANGSCTVKVNVTAPVTGTYNNTSGNLYVGALDTGKTASDSLTMNSSPPAPPPTCGMPLAKWTMDPSQGTTQPPSYYSKAWDVSTAVASYTGTGASVINATDWNPAANSWSVTGGWPTNNTGYPQASSSPYFDFTVDTSNYSNVGIALNYRLNGNWAVASNNHIYVYSSADGGTPTNLIDKSPVSKNDGWLSNSVAASSTGSSTTSFRINAVGQQTGTAAVYLDEISITGCGIPLPPDITKSFSPNPVAVGGTSTLTFAVTNPNSSTGLSGIAFSDSLPSGLTVPDGSSSQCGGTLTALTNAISFSGGSLSGGGSCNITATITATTAGPHDNVSGFINSTQSGANTGATGIASASLTAVSSPSISKQFAPNPILAGGVSKLTFTITNPNPNNSLSGVAFSDTFPVSPGAMVVANPTNASTSGCGSPTFSPVAGAGSVSFSAGTIAAGGTCYAIVNATAPTAGTYNNTSGNVSHIINAQTINGNTASGSLAVEAANPGISFLKQVGLGGSNPWKTFLAIATGGNLYYRFTIENVGDVPLTSISVSDPDVSGEESCTWTDPLPVASASDNNHITNCIVGPVTAASGSHLNTATGSGTYGVPYTDQSTATYATTGLTMDKTATQTCFTAEGNVLNYSYTVTNSGYIALKGPATVSDDKAADEACPALSTVGDGDNYLDTSEAVTCTATYTITASDVTAKQVVNVASATVDGVTSANDSLTVPLTSFTFVKSVVTYSDPVNLTNGNQKAIPGALKEYTVNILNTGFAVANTVVISDPIHADTDLYVNDIGSPGSGPVLFADGAIASGLSYTFVGLTNSSDGLDFYSDAGCTTAYATPTPDADGCDANVRCIKVRMTGEFLASDGSNHPSFNLKFRTRIR